MESEKVGIVTGGSGKLGKELKKLFPNSYFPSHDDFDVTDYDGMRTYLKADTNNVSFVLHCAAITSPPVVDKDPYKTVFTNIVGTGYITLLCITQNLKLIYVCTDYIFEGNKKGGMYKETDPVYPVNNYGWSKLGGECAVRLYSNSLVIRTSMGPVPFPYDKAFVDQYTSREPMSTIAEKIATLINVDAVGVYHIGGKRKTVYQYAKEVSPEKEIGELRLNEVTFLAPKDTSLDTTEYQKLIEGE